MLNWDANFSTYILNSKESLQNPICKAAKLDELSYPKLFNLYVALFCLGILGWQFYVETTESVIEALKK